MQIFHSQSKLRAWYIEYESIPADGKYVHRTVAAIGPDRFYHSGAHGTAQYGWREDPYQQRLIVDGTSVVAEFPAARSFRSLSTTLADPLPGTAPQEFIFLALGWWPFTAKPPPMIAPGAPCDLLDIARSANYRAAAEQENLDGHWCDVMEYPGHDRLWLDVRRNCALVARRIDDPATATPLQYIHLEQFKEIEPGFWMPMLWHNTLFQAGADSAKQINATIRVLDVRLNDRVPGEIFNFVPVPASVRIFDDGHYQQVVPGGTEYLDALVAWISRQANPPPPRSIEAILEYAICAISITMSSLLYLRSRA